MLAYVETSILSALLCPWRTKRKAEGAARLVPVAGGSYDQRILGHMTTIDLVRFRVPFRIRSSLPPASPRKPVYISPHCRMNLQMVITIPTARSRKRATTALLKQPSLKKQEAIMVLSALNCVNQWPPCICLAFTTNPGTEWLLKLSNSPCRCFLIDAQLLQGNYALADAQPGIIL